MPDPRTSIRARTPRRRLAVALAGLAIVLSGCSVGTDSAGDPVPAPVSAPASTASTASTATPAAACAARLLTPRDPVTGKVFARCVVAAMALGHTAELRTVADTGNSSHGDVRFGKTMDGHVRYSDGTEFVALGDQVWYLDDSGSWARPDDGTAGGAVASGAAALWRQLSGLDTWQTLLASSTWKPTGRTDTVNGVQAREYSGRAGLPGLPTTDYLIWISGQDLPLRSTTDTKAYGVEVHAVQDFVDWGKKVSIEPPV